jgi:hypothetical protein
MSAVHTPGPWAVSKRPTAKDGVEHADGFVAFVAIPRTVSDERLDGESWLDMRQRTEGARAAAAVEQEANARLIATAPELLAELQQVYERSYNPFEPDNQSEQYKRVGALIAKATGVAP